MKWTLVVWVLVCGIVLYYNFVDVAKELWVAPLEDWLNSKGYPFGIESIVGWILNALPAILVIPRYITRLGSGGSVKELLEEVMHVATWLKLAVCALLLPTAICFQAKVFNQIRPDYVNER